MVEGPRRRPFVLGILGSPREESHTGILLERVLAGAAAAGARSPASAETELIRLRELSFESCRHCRGCETTGRCVVQDDMQQVYPKLREAQHLVLASPIQFSGVSGETKALIDRAQCCWVEKYRLKQAGSEVEGERRGLFVATCGGKDARVFEWAKHTVEAFFNSTGFRYWGELFEASTDAAPPMTEREMLLEEAEALGRKIVAE